RADAATNDDDKRAILYKEAKICDEQLADRDRAITMYEAALELGLDAPAIAALERLYTAPTRRADPVEPPGREPGAAPTPAEDSADETTWSELERLARVANAEERLAEIYATELDKATTDEPSTARLARRTGELFEAMKTPAASDRALSFYRRAYQFNPEEE